MALPGYAPLLAQWFSNQQRLPTKTSDLALPTPKMMSPLQEVMTDFSDTFTSPSNTVPRIYTLTLRRHTEFISIVYEIAKARYEYVHDLMSNG
jgi:hypothetical protein